MLVYKYVSPIGKKIIENGSIRFSQVDALNDPFEIKPNLDLFVKSIRDFVRKEIDAEDEFRNLTSFQKNTKAHQIAQPAIEELKKNFKENYFVLSLTKKRRIYLCGLITQTLIKAL